MVSLQRLDTLCYRVRVPTPNLATTVSATAAAMCVTTTTQPTHPTTNTAVKAAASRRVADFVRRNKFPF